MQYLIGVMVIAGVSGGCINFLQQYSETNKGWINWLKCVAPSLGAAFLVPLFLKLISSDLIAKSKTFSEELLIFGGFCLIAAILSNSFIDSIGKKILKQAEEANERAAAAESHAQDAKAEVEKNSDTISAVTVGLTEVDDEAQVPPGEVLPRIDNLKIAFADNGLMADDVSAALGALKNSKYVFRTAKGIAREANIPDTKINELMDTLVNRNLVKQIDKEGSKLFALTETGNKMKIW